MKSNKRKYLVLVLLALFVIPFVLVNCGDDNKEKPKKRPKKLEISAPNNGLKVKLGDKIELILNAEDEISDFKLICNNTELDSKAKVSGSLNLTVNSEDLGLGQQTLVFQYVNKIGKKKTDSRRLLVLSNITPEKQKLVEIKSFPHRDSSYTQGLEFYQGKLYEGTGQYGQSIIAQVNLETGEVIKRENLDQKYFGEGITVFNDKLYQITWKSRRCFVRNPETLEQIGQEMEYFGEGWGLTHDSTHLIMSNGSNEITFRNPETLVEERSINVVDDQNEIVNLNELEYIDGFIYANVYQTANIVKIDPRTGQVLAHIDGGDIEIQRGVGSDVFNGIAYNEATKKLYVTGKYWKKLYEVEVR